MNRYIVIYIAALIFIGCKKDIDKGIYYGTASATLNGKTWQATKVRSINIPSLKDKLGFEFNFFFAANKNKGCYINYYIAIHSMDLLD